MGPEARGWEPPSATGSGKGETRVVKCVRPHVPSQRQRPIGTVHMALLPPRPGVQGALPRAVSATTAPHPLPAAVGAAVPRSPASTGDRSRRLRRAGTTLYFMSGPEAPYYFAINFIPHRTMSHTQRHLSSWHLSATVAQIKPDSLILKSGLKTVCFSQQLRTAQFGPSALTPAL